MGWATFMKTRGSVAAALGATLVVGTPLISAGVSDCLHHARNPRPQCVPERACNFGYHPTQWQPWGCEAVPAAAMPPQPGPVVIPTPVSSVRAVSAPPLPVVQPAATLRAAEPKTTATPVPSSPAAAQTGSGGAIDAALTNAEHETSAKPVEGPTLPQLPLSEAVTPPARGLFDGPDSAITTLSAPAEDTGADEPAAPVLPPASIFGVPPVFPNRPAAVHLPPSEAWAPSVQAFQHRPSYRSMVRVAGAADHEPSYRAGAAARWGGTGSGAATPAPGRSGTGSAFAPSRVSQASYHTAAPVPGPAEVLGPSGVNVPQRSYRSAGASPVNAVGAGLNYRTSAPGS